MNNLLPTGRITSSLFNRFMGTNMKVNWTDMRILRLGKGKRENNFKTNKILKPLDESGPGRTEMSVNVLFL